MGTHTLTIRSAGLLALATAAVTLNGLEGAAVAAPAAGTASSAAVPVAAEAAVADRSGGVSVTPASPAPGTDIELRITGCPEHTAVAASDAFVADALLAGADGTLAGETRVRTSARPGKHDVRVLCGVADMRFKGALTVGAAAVFPAALSTSSAAASATSAASASADTSASAAPVASVTPAASAAPASPVAPVRAGGGGTADLVAVDGVAAVDETDGSRASGAGTARSLTVLVLAGAAAAAVALRVSRRRREAD